MIQKQTNILMDSELDLKDKEMSGEACAICSREGSSENRKLFHMTAVCICWVSCWRCRSQAYLGKKMLSTT